MFDDEQCEPPRPDVGRLNRRLRTQQQHADLVDEIERGLSKALQDYRYHAEEVLAKFLVELERSEAAHDLELAKLRAENGRLRDALGLKDSQGPELFQTVLFAQAEAAGRDHRKQAQNKVRSGIASDEEDLHAPPPREPSHARISGRHARAAPGQHEQPGGQWQYFVAWVPNSAALCSPEPWRPLPEGQGPAPPAKGMACPPLPGMVLDGDGSSGQRPRRRSQKDNEGSSDSEEEEEEEREPFELFEAWKVSQRQLERLRKNHQAAEGVSRFSGSHDSFSNLGSDEDEAFRLSEDKHWLIIHPHSYKRAAWDMGSLLMVVYDMVMIPMSAFNLPQSTFLDFMDWTTRLFWTFDMVWSVLTGVVMPDGKINLQFRFILKRYMKTWFTLDCLIVSSDWMEVIVSSTNIIGLGRLARAFRIARVVRLLRLVRMQEVMQSVTERIQSDKLAFALSITKMLLFVLAMAHVMACLWWAVGESGPGSGTWISEKGVSAVEVDSQYLVSLHWSLSQFSGGMDEVTPINTLERFYAVLSWIFGFMSTAVICSIMTSNLTHLHIIGGAQSRHMATLRKYLKQNHITRNLGLRVQRSAQHAVTGDLAAESVELLGLVAEPLRVEMNFEMYSGILSHHPLFSDWVHEDPQVIRRVCHLAVSTSLLAKGDVVFSKGETPREPRMYFVVKGLMEYCCRAEPVTVGERQWVSEAALWTPWIHRGTFSASTEVKMAVLDSKAFQEIVHRFKGKRIFDPRLYAAEFIAHLNKTPKVDDLTFMS